jgi:hypothetical protein
MENKKIFTLKEQLDVLETSYSIGAVESVSKEDKEELIASLKKAIIKYAEIVNDKLKTDEKGNF